MLGVLKRYGDKFWVEYPDPISNTDKLVEVSSHSLSNPHLSTYWVEGREVEFRLVMTLNCTYAIIHHDDYLDEDGWDRIERELSEQDINGVYETLKWLKENYKSPIKK